MSLIFKGLHLLLENVIAAIRHTSNSNFYVFVQTSKLYPGLGFWNHETLSQGCERPERE